MQSPLVSIIIPAYNAQRDIVRCVESVCAQTWNNLEIILLNDGSTDNTLALCKELRSKDPRITVIDKQNTGPSDTRNMGIRYANGTYIQFVDSDDYIDPDYTELLVRAAEDNHADFVIAPYRMLIPSDIMADMILPESTLAGLSKKLNTDKEKKSMEVREYTFLPAGVMDRKLYARHMLEKPATYYYGVLWNKFYRRDILQKYGLQFPMDVKWNEDTAFNMEYIRHAEVFCAIDTPGYNYIQRAQSICHTQITPASVVANRARMFRCFKKFYEDLGMYEEMERGLYKFLFSLSESCWPSGTVHKLVESLGGTSQEDMLEAIEKAAEELEEKERQSQKQEQ